MLDSRRSFVAGVACPALVLVACAPPESAPPRVHEVEVAPEPPAPEPPPEEPVSFDICVNELMPDTVASARDEDGHVADWIELHNPTTEPVALDGWTVTDDPEDRRKHVLRGGLVLEPGGFLLLWADDAPELGPTHLGFALSSDGEAVGLFTPDGDGAVVEFGATPGDLSIARRTDCCASDDGTTCLEHVFAGSPGVSNGA